MLGDVLWLANRRRRWSAPEDEDDGDGEDEGLPGLFWFSSSTCRAAADPRDTVGRSGELGGRVGSERRRRLSSGGRGRESREGEEFQREGGSWASPWRWERVSEA